MKNDFYLSTNVRRNPWIPDLSQVIIFISLAYCLRDFFVCSDTVWQVKIGEWIWQHRTVPKFDPGFSVSASPIPWKDHQWLGQLILFGLWNVGGFLGLRVILGLIPALIFGRVLMALRRQGVSPLSAFMFTIVAAVSSAHHWLARPHLLAYVLLVISLALWEKSYEGDRRAPFLLALVQVVWANLHQTFLIQFIFAGAFAFQMMADIFQKRKSAGRRIGNIVALLIFLPLMSVLNPQGLGAFSSAGSTWAIRAYIVEWQPVYFHSKHFPFYFAYALILLVAFWKNRKNVRVSEIAIYIVTVSLTMTAVRQIPIFVLSTLPSYIRHVPVLSKVSGSPGKNARRSNFLNAVSTWYFNRNVAIHLSEQSFSGKRLTALCWAFLFFLSVAAFHIPKVGQFSWDGLNRNFFPVPASDFMEKEGIYGNVFSVYAWGGYLIYRFGNANKVFIDGRTDMYGPERLEEYDQISEARSGWGALLEKYTLDVILGASEWNLCEKLLHDGRWSLVYSDKQASVFVLKSKFPQIKTVIPAPFGQAPVGRSVRRHRAVGAAKAGIQ